MLHFELTGQFEMQNIPSELSQIKVWLPKYDRVDTQLKLGEKKTVALTRNSSTYGSLVLERLP